MLRAVVLVLLVGLALQSTLAEELYAKRISTELFFPECGEQSGPACEHDLIVTINRDLSISDDEVIGSGIALLPRALLSSALFFMKAASDECRHATLSEELTSAQQQSVQLGEVPLITHTSEAISGCFGVSDAPPSVTQLFPIWISGRMVGWVECDLRVGVGGSCDLTVAIDEPQRQDGPTPTTLAVRVSLLSPYALEPLIENVGVLLGRILSQTSFSDEFAETIELLRDSPATLDDRAKRVIRCVMVLARCPA